MISSDIQKLNPGSLIELFEMDDSASGGDILRWHNGVNEVGNNVVWQGRTYSRFPVEASGFERTGKGSLPRPTLKVSNVTGTIGALVREREDLVGAQVIRRRTFVRYLDAINFPGGINPSADPNVGFPDESWQIDRKVSENGIYVEFELAAAFDVQGVKIPRRQCIQNSCVWIYRGPECGYTGSYVDIAGNPTADPAKDVCSKRLGDGCKPRFGEFEALPFGAFPGCGMVR